MLHLKTRERKILADIITPVGIYLKVRDHFANSFLLESSDYHGGENSISYICCLPIASFSLEDDLIKTTFPTGESSSLVLTKEVSVVEELTKFSKSFQQIDKIAGRIQTGLFGHMSYDAVAHFEDIEINQHRSLSSELPLIKYQLFKYIIALDHFKNECYLTETYLDEPNEGEFSQLLNIIANQNIPSFSFSKKGNTTSNFTDDEFLERVQSGIKHCDLGDVFQVVFSRQFQTEFRGDEFQLYRALRSINPSPYLFYFDYGGYKIFGSSPEAQIVIKDDVATIYPIAGTFRRTGNDKADAELANKLLEDPKENAEHIMLVDLARNDLSKNADNVVVETYKEVQYYSHVIHLVSKVSGQLKKDSKPLDIVASTFPAGTLSGAPKHRAMQLIAQYEKTARGFYGGAIGFMDFDGNFNHAIMIRTFMSKKNQLFFQAGAGIVSKSNPEGEVQEVYNKLAALEGALDLAQNID
ncbi:MAG: anthranilate synthase component I family protein [Cyclobacteriaceae bacterium]